MEHITSKQVDGAISREISFPAFLKREFLKKIRINNSFSLRSYARFLDIHFATLSQIMSEKRTVTEKTIRKLAPRLNASELQIESWVKSINEKQMDSEESDFNIFPYKVIEDESLELLSEWYHDAIVELVMTKNFKPDIAYIAKAFNLSRIEAEMAVKRLFKLGLLKVSDKGCWEVANEFKTTITSDLKTSVALRKYQSDLLQKSMDSIEIIPVEKRTHSSLVVAMNKEQLKEVKDEIRALRAKIHKIAMENSQSKEADSVYGFCFSGFPVADLH